jgi:hypothetical protein
MKKLKIVLIAAFILLQALTVSIILQSRSSKEFAAIGHKRIANSTVCPPFHLYDEDGELINPVAGINTDKPYSPKQTCGKCHDYDLITQGYHFQQGKDEMAGGSYSERYQWVSHPGNYGGNWCSPAPLYRYLSSKENSSARMMDMTSFTFITAGCGACHPGGGSAEYDRMGNRYDKHMAAKGYESGAVNDYDGDYYQARWIETGVLEGDCMICHNPGYENEERLKQLKSLNFRWAPVAATGWAEVKGSVDKNVPVTLSYDLSQFDVLGRLSPHIVREPRNDACLFCHAQPGWKKRGANYGHRSDVHIRAGMKCVDCHPAGSMAFDERINQREMHQFGKGDDPGGMVRNDLDNTVVSCNQCHTSGHMGAPVAKHAWLPALHLDRMACQTCHIPERFVKPAQVQASDVFNPGTKISTPGKHLWVFYGPDMNYYNHYGNLEMMGFDDKPSDIFQPDYIRYKGKIHPANRVHSTWPGIEVEGKPGLMQPKMSDIYKMWQDHFSDPANYPSLAIISDDNEDGVIEVNRPEEIEALISAVSEMLSRTKYPMEGKRVVWAMNDRVYTSGDEFYTIEKEAWEASPYANTHTYNHDVLPANAALGAKGCTECHSLGANIFYSQVVRFPFGADALPEYEPQYVSLGMNPLFVWLSAVREQYIKTIGYAFLMILALIIIISLIIQVNRNQNYFRLSTGMLWTLYAVMVSGFILVFLRKELQVYILPDRLWLDKNHFLVSILALIVSAYVLMTRRKEGKNKNLLTRLLGISMLIVVVSGVIMLLKFQAVYPLVVLAYTTFDIGIVLAVIFSLVYFIDSQYKSVTSNG